MLNTPADFPYAGAFAVFAEPGQELAPCRILRQHGDGTALIALAGAPSLCNIASGNRTVPAAQLFRDAAAAQLAARVTKPSRARA